MNQRLSVAVVSGLAAVSLLLTGCSKGPVDTDPTVNPTSAGSVATTEPTVQASANALETQLRQVATSLTIPGETGEPAVTSGAAARQPLIQLRDSVTVTPDSCTIAGLGLATLVTSDSPFVQAVYPKTKTAVSVVAAKDEAAAKAFIAARDGARAGCSKVTLASGAENSAVGTITYPELKAPTMVDGEAMTASFEGATGITQVMGRKGSLIYLAVAQGNVGDELSRLIQIAETMQQTLPES